MPLETQVSLFSSHQLPGFRILFAKAYSLQFHHCVIFLIWKIHWACPPDMPSFFTRCFLSHDLRSKFLLFPPSSRHRRNCSSRRVPVSARPSATEFSTSTANTRAHHMWHCSSLFVTPHMCWSNVASTLFLLPRTFPQLAP